MIFPDSQHCFLESSNVIHSLKIGLAFYLARLFARCLDNFDKFDKLKPAFLSALVKFTLSSFDRFN